MEARLVPKLLNQYKQRFRLTVTIDKPAIILVPDIIRWRVLVNGFIASKITNKETSVIDTTQGNHFVEDVWMLQEEIEGMVGTIEQPVVIIGSNQPVLCLIKGIASSIT